MNRLMSITRSATNTTKFDNKSVLLNLKPLRCIQHLSVVPVSFESKHKRAHLIFGTIDFSMTDVVIRSSNLQSSVSVNNKNSKALLKAIGICELKYRAADVTKLNRPD